MTTELENLKQQAQELITRITQLEAAEKETVLLNDCDDFGIVSFSLTGRSRFRTKKTLFGKTVLILQVEEHQRGHIDDEEFGYQKIDRTSWRDAEVSDLTITQGGTVIG